LFKNLVEFRRRSGERKSNHFLRRHVRRRKYFSACKSPVKKGILFDSNDPASSCPRSVGSAYPKASQSFAAAAAKESQIIFFGDMCGEENTARPANVRAVCLWRTARALQQAANPFVKKVLLF